MSLFWSKSDVLFQIVDVINTARNKLFTDEGSGMNSIFLYHHLAHFYFIGVRFLEYKNETGEDQDSKCFEYHSKSLEYSTTMPRKEKNKRIPNSGYLRFNGYDIMNATIPTPPSGTPRVAVTNHRAFLRFYGAYVIPKVIEASHYSYDLLATNRKNRLVKNEVGVERLKKFNAFFLELTEFLFGLEDRGEYFTQDKLCEWFRSTDLYVESEMKHLRFWGREPEALAVQESAVAYRAKAAAKREAEGREGEADDAAKRIRLA